MSYYLAVDAGGTKTEFVLGDDERELARVRTGTIKRMRTDEATADRNLREALNKLALLSGVGMNEVRQTCIGTAGETVLLVTEWLREAFAGQVSGGLEIIGDVEGALDAAFQGSRGVLALAGTGSNVAGRTRNGTLFTAGGWGPQMADQGSAHFIGLEGLRRGFLALDQQRPSQILNETMQFWNLASLDSLVEFANAIPPPDYSRLAPLIVDCATRGDSVAGEVLEQGGRDLAYLADLVIARVLREECAESQVSEPLKIAVAGSVLERVQPLRAAFEKNLLASYPKSLFELAVVDPVMGPLWRARKAVGVF